MKIYDPCSQMIVRNENLVDELSIDSKYVIYAGLGHVVLDVMKLKEDNEVLFENIKKKEENNYFFRFSIMMNTEEDEDVVYRLLNDNLFDFKPKILTPNEHCFLGMKCYVVKLEKLSKSKNFKDVNKYHCTIKSLSLDNDGNIIEEEIWDKEKYGEIESFLPKELEKFIPILEFMRSSKFVSLRVNKLLEKNNQKKFNYNKKQN